MRFQGILIVAIQGITKDTKPIRIASRKMNESECSELDCQNARFGFALTSIGDVDRDGFGGKISLLYKF